MKKIFIIDSGTYPYDTLVAVGTTSQEIFTYLEKKFGYKVDEEEKKSFDFNCVGKSIPLKNNANVLWLKRFTGDISSHAILNHEIFHIVYQILVWKVSIKLTDESEEAFSYLIEYITKQILQQLIKK